MAKSPDFIGASESENGVRRDTRWSEEYDRLPLKQRLKLLYTRNSFPETLPELNSENRRNSNSSVATNHVVVKQEDNDSERPGPASFGREEKIGNSSSQQIDNGGVKDQVTEANQMTSDTVTGEKVIVAGSKSVQHPLFSENVVSSEVFSDKSPSGSSVDRLAAIKVKTESPVDIFDDLDVLPLIQRRGMLLSRQKIGLNNSSAKVCAIRLSISAENQKNLISSSELPYQDRSSSPFEHPFQQNRSSNGGIMTIVKEKNSGSFLKKKLSGSDAKVGKHPPFGRATMLNPAIKTEPLEENKTIGNKIPAASLPPNQIALVQYNYNIADDSDADELDHMLLSERMELFSKKVKVPNLEIKGTKSSSKVVFSGLEGQPIVPEAFKGLRGSRKRKRTATDSVETALDEDAPGLLQVLIEQGVSVDEIKLYGQAESDEAIDDLSSDDNFTELESVIAKLFSQRTSLLKFAPLRCGKGEKATYCLACLFSLVEQARYLVFRKWPVEWGWCRDLQSFIFVFKRHNRIVLERPEYGYATYFFELMDSLPVDWQIKRLVIAMKLTSYSRVTLLENKALEVGEDLTEGEAKVLMDYGWIPNTGLGTMLNYRDRVVHDSKNERDTSEWRTKIGKLLVDGYNSGTVVSADLPRKALEYNFIQSPELNLEVSQRKEIKLEVE